MKTLSGSIGALRPYGVEQDSPEYETWITNLYESYFNAGCSYVKTDTFNVNPNTFGERFHDIMKQRLKLCTSFYEKGDFLFDIGPLGVLLEPYGNYSMRQAYEDYRAILSHRYRHMNVLFETFNSLTELRLALMAYYSYDFKPTNLFVSMSFESNGKTISGDTLEAYVNLCHAFNVAAIGINCNLTAGELIPIVKELKEIAGNTQVFVQPNKSHPHADGSYDDVCFHDIESLLPYVDMIGGCCGFNPDDIAKVVSLAEPIARKNSWRSNTLFPSSNTIVLDVGRTIICGDRLNVYGSKKFRELVKTNNYSGIVEMASEQLNAGADILDLCVDTGNVEQDVITMRNILLVLSTLDVPIQIDTQEREVLNEALIYSHGVPVINSFKPAEFNDAGLYCQHFGSMAIMQTFESKVDTEQGSRYRLSYPVCMIQDLQTLSLTEGSSYADETIDLMKTLPHRTMIGLTNISYGLPQRSNINAAYFIRCIETRPFLLMCNVNDPILGPLYKAWLYQRGFITSDEYVGVQHDNLVTLQDYIVAGIMPPSNLPVDLDSITEALEVVGDLYERKVYYVPQLIQAANVAKKLLPQCIGSARDSTNPSIIIATVRGDIHDIGKNIVKAVAQAHNLSILDLGYDVPPETIVSRITSETKIVALSGLITNSLKSMRDTIEAVHSANPNIKCIVGGAVVDSSIADSMDALYGATPIEFVNLCKSILKEY